MDKKLSTLRMDVGNVLDDTFVHFGIRSAARIHIINKVSKMILSRG